MSTPVFPADAPPGLAFAETNRFIVLQAHDY
jgi:hypothetical protein